MVKSHDVIINKLTMDLDFLHQLFLATVFDQVFLVNYFCCKDLTSITLLEYIASSKSSLAHELSLHVLFLANKLSIIIVHKLFNFGADSLWTSS